MQQIIDFIVELIKRWVSPTPTFFKTLRTISIIIGIITSIAPILSLFDIQFNLGISLVLQKIISVAAFIAAIVSQLSVQTPVPANMPYTTAVEAKKK
jgi:uncharacterized membrane protein HdeD (DUF308 family)